MFNINVLNRQLKRKYTWEKKALSNSFSNKRTYKYLKDHGTDITFENEVDKDFLEDLANNTPNEEQFKEKDLGKVKTNNRKSRRLQVLWEGNNQY